MALYFETELQGISFLLLCGAGFVFALVFDGIGALIPSSFKIVSDILLFLISGVAFLFVLFLLREGALRYFHWLALFVGAILYTCGIRRLIDYVIPKLRGRKTLKSNKNSTKAD